MCLCVRLCAFICSQAYVRITHKFRSPALSLIFILTLHIVRWLLCFESLIIILYYLLRSLSTVSLILAAIYNTAIFIGICVPPTVIYLLNHVSGSTLTAVGRSQLLVRWPGTHSRILFGIQRATQTVLGVYSKCTCSRDTSASSGSTENARLGNTRPDLSVWRPWAGSLLEAPTNPQML